jgi:hypothetical protein
LPISVYCQWLTVNIVCNDPGTFTGQFLGDGPADTAGGAGDNRHAP